ncbi:MAG: CBS domain-containing protein [Thermoplasmata archaeon]|nr:CBS domain-containing protein [Thermoplasmata archaeon]
MPVEWPLARDLMTPKPITVSTEAQVSRALGIMRAESIHEIPVLKDGRLVGMVTFDAIARRTNLPLSTKVEHLMVIPPFFAPTAPYPELAQQLLAVGLRGAPVLGKRGELLGIVSRTDLVRVLPDLAPLADRAILDVASPASLILHEEDPVSGLFNQVRLLEEHPLPVVDRRGHLVGAVGLADLGRVLWKREAPGRADATVASGLGEIRIATIMHSPPVTVGRNATAGAGARAMSEAHVSSVFLVEDGKPTEIVSQVDLLGLAVGLGEPSGGTSLGDVQIQITGLRGSGDPELLSEIDQIVAKGLRHIAHHARPTILSLHVSPHSGRPGDASVHARLHTDRGMFYATETGWNFFASVSGAMEELQAQVQRSHDSSRTRKRRGGRPAASEDEVPADVDVEEKLRQATGRDGNDAA